MWVDKLVESKQMLIDGLTSNKKVIEKILNGIHSPLTCEQLIKTAKDALDTTEKFHQTAESVSNTFGIFITTCVKKWGYEFMSDLGLHHLIPKSLLPPAKPPWEIPKYKTITVHYPPLNLITKPSMLKQALKPNEIAASLKKILETDSSMLSSKGKTAEEIKSLVLIDKKDKKTKTHHKVINQWSLIK
jgi:hypothetical protein